MRVLLVLMLMWGIVITIYTVLFFPNIVKAAKHAAHPEAEAPPPAGTPPASETKPEHPPYPRAA
jgi:hypothetical protein